MYTIDTTGDSSEKQEYISVKKSNNNIYFFDIITDITVLETISNINSITFTVDQFDVVNKLKPAINIYINSYGGLVTSGLCLADYICMIKKNIDINTIILGSCMSAATFVSVVGSKRYMTSNSVFLIHQLSGELWGKFSELQDGVKNYNLLMNIIKEHYKKYTELPEKKLKQLLKSDLFLSPQECLKYKIVDEVISI